MNSNQLNLNIEEQTDSEIIASSRYNFRIELIHKIGKAIIKEMDIIIPFPTSVYATLNNPANIV